MISFLKMFIDLFDEMQNNLYELYQQQTKITIIEMSSQTNSLFSTMRKILPPSILSLNRFSTTNDNDTPNPTPFKQNTIIKDLLDLVQQSQALMREARQKEKEKEKEKGIEQDEHEIVLCMKVKADLVKGQQFRVQLRDRINSMKDPQLVHLLSPYSKCQEAICQALYSLLPPHAISSINTMHNLSNQSTSSSSQSQSQSQSQSIYDNQPQKHWFLTNDHDNLDNPSEQSSNLLLPKRPIKKMPPRGQPKEEEPSYTFGNGMHQNQLPRTSKQLQHGQKWSEQEQDSLFGYKFDDDRTKWQNEIRRIILSKSLQSVIKRYVQLGVQVNHGFKNMLMQLVQRTN